MDLFSSNRFLEEFHKGLKSGCKIEQRQLQTRPQLEKLLGMFSIVCYNLLLMRYEAREETTGQIVLNPIQVKLLKDKFKKEIHRKLTPKKLLVL